MAYFDRFDICAAYWMFDILWNPTEYSPRLRRLGYAPSYREQFLENLSDNAKEIYGALVRRHHALMVGFERYAKRNPIGPKWPGTYNMPRGDTRAWLASQGILTAVESMVTV